MKTDHITSDQVENLMDIAKKLGYLKKSIFESYVQFHYRRGNAGIVQSVLEKLHKQGVDLVRNLLLL